MIKNNIFICLFCFTICYCNSQIIAKSQKKQPIFNSIQNPKNIGNDTLIKDTLVYFRQDFMNKKEKYLNQPLDSMLNNLKIQVKSYKTSSAANNRFISPGMYLSFFPSVESDYREAIYSIKPVIVWIKWETPLLKDSIHALLIKKETNRRDWGNDERAYFGKQIVKDFGFVDFTKYPK